MYRNVLEAIQGIEIYPVLSLFIFIIFFMTVLAWIYQADPSHLKKMAELPLDPADVITPHHHQLNFNERNHDVGNL